MLIKCKKTETTSSTTTGRGTGGGSTTTTTTSTALPSGESAEVDESSVIDYSSIILDETIKKIVDTMCSYYKTLENTSKKTTKHTDDEIRAGMEGILMVIYGYMYPKGKEKIGNITNFNDGTYCGLNLQKVTVGGFDENDIDGQVKKLLDEYNENFQKGYKDKFDFLLPLTYNDFCVYSNEQKDDILDKYLFEINVVYSHLSYSDFLYITYPSNSEATTKEIMKFIIEASGDGEKFFEYE